MVNPSISIRPATQADLPFLLSIDKEGCERDGIVWHIDERKSLIQTFAEGNHDFAILTCDSADTIAGILIRALTTSNPKLLVSQRQLLVPRIGEGTRYADIFDIWIHPEHRRKGIATQLKLALEGECRNRSIEWIFTFQRFDNLPAIRMNEKLGYQHIGVAAMWDDVPRVCFLKHVLPEPHL